ICGHPHPRSGEILFEGQKLSGHKTHEIMRLGISQVPEGRRIFPRMTVLENLSLGAAMADPDWYDDDLKMVQDLFPRLAERSSQRAGTLSGGEQQMLAIGRALMARPRLLLLDEPSLGLAPLIVKQIFEIIAELNRRQGMTILLVEQNALQALKIAHRGYVLQHGELVMSGSGVELLADPRVRAAYLGAS
ncbi:MAG: ABC transporter ATP-binding protein, partial [Alphaproteobacteria bacterium]|nr:ABC transporter ATP-binding protein [Alphaproteobacteria bacterium]